MNLAKSLFRRDRVAGEAQRRQVLPSDSSGAAAGDPSDRLCLRQALEHLTPRQRESVLLRFLEDLSVEQTADVMGCSAGTVKKLTARALGALRERIDEDFEVSLNA